MTYNIMEGLLMVNGRDVWKEYGAWLAEEKEGESRNYSALLKVPAVKGHTAVNFRERDGEELPEELKQRWEPRDVQLRFAISAGNEVEFMERRNAFVSFLKEGDRGWLRVEVPELGRTYRMHYADCSDYEHLRGAGGEVAGVFTVKLREPKPEM